MTRPTLRFMSLQAIVTVVILAFCTNQSASAQKTVAIHFDSQSHVFRIDAAGMTYAFGINENDELQTIYWGSRLGDNDPLPSPKASLEVASFDSPAATTPQEFPGWGGALYVEPALKITFPDGNRDLALHYVSHTIGKDGLIVVLKDISRNVFVDLHYTIDEATGILGRSAVITNRTQQPLTIEQAAAASWNLPSGTDYTLRYRNWSEPGWDAVPIDQQKEVYVKYIQNLYSILGELRATHT